jgi:hypothetical protein
LAKLRGDFKGNPFKAVVDLVDHEGLRLKRDITLHGIVEEMLTMQCLVGIHYIQAPMFFGSFSFDILSFLIASFSPVHGFVSSTATYGRSQPPTMGRRAWRKSL